MNLPQIRTAFQADTRRSFTVTHKPQPDWSLRAGLDWVLRKYGHGAWCVADGEPNYFATEAAAYQAGDCWNVTGRSAQA